MTQSRLDHDPVGAAGQASIAGANLMMNRMILAGMIMGQVVFAGVMAVAMGVRFNTSGQLVPGAPGISPSVIQMLLLICTIVAAGAIPTAFLMRHLIRRRISPTATPAERAQQATSGLMISGALMESFGIFGLVICLLSHNFWPGGIFPIISIIGLLLLMPRRDEFDAAVGGRAGVNTRSDSVGGIYGEPERWNR